jgi:dipeptidyl aminopeptidase/acylaminoacyl peptidase
MGPEHLGDFVSPSDPRLHPDGTTVAFTVTKMDLEDDRYLRRIWIWDGAEARPLTKGPSDTSPRWSPDGRRLAFLRKGGEESDRSQVAVMPISGGEGEVVTALELGVTELEWSPDGSTIAVVAPSYIAEWQDLDDDERKRRPHRIVRLPFRFDNLGAMDDRRSHVFLIDPSQEQEPKCLTPGDYDDSRITWDPAGSRIAFLSARHQERGLDPGTQVWTVSSSGGEPVAITEVGNWDHVSYDRAGRLHVIGMPDRWSHPDVAPMWRVEGDGSLTDLTGHLDRNLITAAPPLTPRGPRWLDDGSYFSTLEDRGMVRVIHGGSDGAVADVIDGERAVTGIDPRPDGTAAVFVATTATDPGELHWWENGVERTLTSLNETFRNSVPLVAPQRFTYDSDGTEIEGWVYLPDGEDRVPLLLNIHGGPATQYGYGFFDEFQIYAGAGYGVVATNPRGSTGYGSAHVRAVVGRWQDPAPPDMRDLAAAPQAAAAAFPRLNPDRLGVMGGSYGGFATVRLVSSHHRFVSAIAERGLYSWPSFTGTSDIGPWFDRVYLDAQPPKGWQTLWEASPLAMAHHIQTPTLILHSEGDWRCPVEQGEQLFKILLQNGAETELVRFPAPEGHELSRSGKPKHRADRFAIVLGWHQRHLA